MKESYISAAEYAAKFGISERTARHYCATGKIEGAFLTGKTWNIPADTPIPGRRSKKRSIDNPLLSVLKEQMLAGLRGSIYHYTQVELTYNSNHIEGSRLTEEQTRHIFETNTLGISEASVNVDDIIETSNHFRCVDYIIAHAEERLTEAFIKELHRLLKSGTSDSTRSWFAVGEYKQLPNEVGGIDTSEPEDVARDIKTLLRDYYRQKGQKSFDDILNFHHRFECIHPFQDGNGRVGRLLLFKECLCHRHVPFIITDSLKMFYYRGLQQWPHIREYLRDTCLTAQDFYRFKLKQLRIPH